MSKSLRVALGAAFVTVMSLGCSPINMAYFLFRGDQKAPAEFPLTPKEGEKDVTIVVLASAPNASWEFAAVDRELASHVGRRIYDQTKAGKHPIKAIEQAKLDRFKASNPNWRAQSASEIGKQLGADYVLDLTLASVNLYQQGSGKLMYEGQASIEVAVYDSAAGQQHSHYYVNPHMEPRPADSMLMAQYKTKLLERIADEVSWKHIAHANEQQIAPPVR